MGACDISMTVRGNATRDEVNEAFRARQAEDRDCNGHRDGYSGDFQTVNSIKFTDKVFTDYNEAYEYCLDNAQKWSYVVAVKVVNDTDASDPKNFWLIAGLGAE